MANLDARHHTLIQALLARGPLLEKEVKSIYNTLCQNNSGSRERDFHEYIGNINKELAFLQFEVRASTNQYDSHVYYGVINKVADEQAKLGTQYSLPQIAFFKAVMEAILHDQSGKGQISNIEALNIRLETQARSESQVESSQIPAAFKQFSMAQKEKTLEDLLRNRWLCATEEGKIGLGVRAFLELRSLFKDFEVPFCDVCNEAGIKAELCRNEECPVRMHSYCLKRKFQHQQVDTAMNIGIATRLSQMQPSTLSFEDLTASTFDVAERGPPCPTKGIRLHGRMDLTASTADVAERRHPCPIEGITPHGHREDKVHNDGASQSPSHGVKRTADQLDEQS